MPTKFRGGMTGKIVDGEYAGYSIRIDDDSEKTGGYFILIWQESPQIGYDDWVESADDIGPFLDSVGWKIEWLEE